MDTTRERPRLAGGTVAAANMTPEQRRERARAGQLGSAVATVERRAGDLTGEQIQRLLRALTAASGNG